MALPQGWKQLTIIDLESGGLDVRTHPILEVAHAHLHGPITEVYNTEAAEDQCTQEACDLTGFFERPPLGEGLSEKDLALHIHAELKDRVLVAANPHFDIIFLRALLERYDLLDENGQTPWHYQAIDIKSLALGWVARNGGINQPGPWSQAHTAYMMGGPLPKKGTAHSAAGDVKWTRAMLTKILQHSWTDPKNMTPQQRRSSQGKRQADLNAQSETSLEPFAT